MSLTTVLNILLEIRRKKLNIHILYRRMVVSKIVGVFANNLVRKNANLYDTRLLIKTWGNSSIERY